MKSIDREAKAKSFVRQYCFNVAADLPENELARFLMENQALEIAREGRDQNGTMLNFNRWLSAEIPDSECSENEDLQLLFKERKELTEIWLKFQAKYPEYNELLPNTKRPPSIERLRSIMKNTAQDWENKRDGGFGRAKEKIIGFSESLVSFSDLFSIIPQGDKYVSLFTGVISTTIKAAARHKEIAEGFSSALEEIGKEMTFSTHELKIHRTKKMERLVIRLYIRHAKFFCHFMNWYLSSSLKRLGISLQNDFYTKEVKQRVSEIRSVAKEIEQEASLITQVSTQQTERMVRSLGLTMEELARRADLYHNMNTFRFETIDKHLELLARWIGELSRNHIVDHCGNLLYKADLAGTIELAASRDELVDRHIEDSQPNNSTPPQFETSVTRNTDVPTRLSRGLLLFTRPSLQQLSRNLQQYFPSTNAEGSSHGNRDLATHTVSGLIVVKLQEWLASPRSELLWIIGSSSTFGNEASLAASHILDIAISARLPYLSFSCTPLIDVSHANTRNDVKTRCTALLIAMLYSLMHQLLCLIPETFEDAYDLEDAIQTMNGGDSSIPKALEIIQTLLRHRPPLLLVVLDGLELLEDESSVPHLRNLISIIHSREADSRLKVLLGSQGFLESAVGLDVDECVDCMSLGRRRPGGAHPGGMSLGHLGSFSMQETATIIETSSAE